MKGAPFFDVLLDSVKTVRIDFCRRRSGYAKSVVCPSEVSPIGGCDCVVFKGAGNEQGVVIVHIRSREYIDRVLVWWA